MKLELSSRCRVARCQSLLGRSVPQLSRPHISRNPYLIINESDCDKRKLIRMLQLPFKSLQTLDFSLFLLFTKDLDVD